MSSTPQQQQGSGGGGGAGGGKAFQTVTCTNQKTEVVDGNKVLSNVLYDCTHPNGSIEINVKDNASVVNVGIKGKNEASGVDSDGRKMGFHVRSNGQVLLDNIYMGDGSIAGHNCPLFVNRNSKGSVTLRHLNIQNWPDNCVYASTPAKEGKTCEIHIRNSYARNTVSGIYRIGYGSIKNCTAVSDAPPPAKINPPRKVPPRPPRSHSCRAIWVRNNAVCEVDNVDVFFPHEGCNRAIDVDDNGRATVSNSRFGPRPKSDWTDGNVTLNNVTGGASKTAPPGVPLTAEEAASGTSSADGTKIPPGTIAGTGAGVGTYIGSEIGVPFETPVGVPEEEGNRYV